MRKYELPNFLVGQVDQAKYERWLRLKARAHAKGDVKRFGLTSTAIEYRDLIHSAVCASNGIDFYTGEKLEWEKISTYSNDESKAGRSKYKAGFALLPSVDHVWREDGKVEFVICGWRTNAAKADLPLGELLDLCARILRNHGYRVEEPGVA